MSNSILPPPPTTGNPLLDAALVYHARGWAVIPTEGKAAACLWKCFQRARPTAEALAKLFDDDVIDGLAVILGSASRGLAVRDFDEEGAYHRWAAAHPDLAGTLPTVQTARGKHVYHQAAEERFFVLPDGEYRGDAGHYVLLPPSRHPSGHIYTWTIPLPDGPLPLVPAEVFIGSDRQAIQGNPKATQDTQANSILHVSFGKLGKLLTQTLPTGPGQRNKQVFELVRGLMAVPGLDTSISNLRLIVRKWWGMCLPNIRTKDFDTTWTDFVISWQRAKFPRGATFETAVAQAKAVKTPKAGLIYDSSDYRLLVSLCAVLQERWGKKPFPLSCRIAGDALGFGKDKVWRILQTMKADEIIEEVTKGIQGEGSGKASEWQFIGKA